VTPSRVKQIRRRLGLTQKQLSQRLGVHLVTVKKWETGAYVIGRQAAVRLWLLEQEALGDSAGQGRDLVDALAHPDGGGVLGLLRGAAPASSLVIDGRERHYRRIECPGRSPGVVFAFEDLEPEEFEAARQTLLERALTNASASHTESGSDPPAERKGRLDAWVRPDWLRGSR
jgi:transcriptional regulator with XRE-family HTH domain